MAANGAWCSNVPHITILEFRYRLHESLTTWNHPRSGWPPGTIPAQDWHICFKPLWDRRRPSTVTVTETPGPTFIKPDQRNPWIKDQLWNDLLSTILHLQLPNFVSCGRDKPSHMTKFGNSRCEIVGRRVIFIWSLIHGLRWSGLIKAEPGRHNARISTQTMSNRLRRFTLGDTLVDVPAFGNRICLIDESMFCLPHSAGRVMVWHCRGERHADACVTEHQGVMVWGMHSHGRKGLVVLNRRLDVQSYVDKVIQFEVVTTSKVVGRYFSRTTPFRFLYASHRTLLYQMQSAHCPSQHNPRPVPHRASARYPTDRQIRSRDPPPQIMVQLCLVIQKVWEDIPQARNSHLIIFMQRRCRTVHAAHGLSQRLLTLLRLTVCCTEQNAIINFCLTIMIHDR